MKAVVSRLLRVIKFAFIYFIASSILAVIVLRFVPPVVTPLMLIRVAEQISDGRPVKLKKDWEPSERISRNLKLAVLSSEDQRFNDHYGFDFDAIKKAMASNKKGKGLKGASTISQQVAKNVFLWPSRSWLRKGLEVYFTVLIEIFWSKERIMEVYLNVIEMGDGIYGAEAASQYYFRKSCKNLTKSEAAMLASVLPNPVKWNPLKQTPYLSKRKVWIITNMERLPEVKWINDQKK
ncbi:MAG: monofunctional biosynthetic peptidoglycan transglycosylase [Cytophagaceae bacterium]